jgi:hypothetical protein
MVEVHSVDLDGLIYTITGRPSDVFAPLVWTTTPGGGGGLLLLGQLLLFVLILAAISLPPRWLWSKFQKRTSPSPDSM